MRLKLKVQQYQTDATGVRFVFSHTAHREGWDNPNVFQICTLKESGSETSKRQEVGRGVVPGAQTQVCTIGAAHAATLSAPSSSPNLATVGVQDGLFAVRGVLKTSWFVTPFHAPFRVPNSSCLR